MSRSRKSGWNPGATRTITPPMHWGRVHNIIRFVKAHPILTQGQQAAITAELARMDTAQLKRYCQDTSGNLAGVTV